MAAKRGNIVIVEDDWGLNEALKRVLQAAGFAVTGFNAALPALHSDATRDADCLVVDVNLGDMSGYDLQRRLAAQGHAPPIIIITAHDDAANRVRAQSIGAFAYMAKPFSGRALVDAVSRLLSRGEVKGEARRQDSL
ncbi:MAG: response regulator transcription factor [Povalibacter sp.]|jgi:DNA-binding response OmpR family regulator